MKWDENTMRVRPRLKNINNITGMSLSPEEGFVISLIDGKTTIEEICTLSTLPREKTLELITSMINKGIIKIDDAEAPVSKWWGGRRKSESKIDTFSEKKETSFNSNDQFLNVPREVVDDIEKMYNFVQKHNYYDILGVPRKASREAIKNAYRILSRKYHPDQYYLKVPEDLRKKLDIIFATISEAYSTLSHPKLRQEYDEELITGTKKKKVAVDISTAETSSFKEKGYRLVSLGDEAFKNREYLSALNNYKLALQMLGETPSLKEKIRRAKFVLEITRKVERIENDEMLLELDTVKELLQELRGNVDLLPSDEQLLVRIVSIILNLTRAYNTAIDILMRLITLNPNKFEYYFMLADARENAGDISGAMQELEKVLKMDKKNQIAREKIKSLKAKLKKG